MLYQYYACNKLMFTTYILFIILLYSNNAIYYTMYVQLTQAGMFLNIAYYINTHKIKIKIKLCMHAVYNVMHTYIYITYTTCKLLGL